MLEIKNEFPLSLQCPCNNKEAYWFLDCIASLFSGKAVNFINSYSDFKPQLQTKEIIFGNFKKSRQHNECICNLHYCHLLFHKWTFVLSNIELSVSVLNGQLTISSLIRKPTGYPVNFLFPYPKHNATRFCNLLQQFGA